MRYHLYKTFFLILVCVLFVESYQYTYAANGVCGSANNGNTSTVPTSGLCSAGSTSGASGFKEPGYPGSWQWICHSDATAPAGGANAYCFSSMIGTQCAFEKTGNFNCDGNGVAAPSNCLGQNPADFLGTECQINGGIDLVTCSSDGNEAYVADYRGNNACVADTEPNTPTLSGDTSGTVNTTTSNWVTATDPDGDTIYYELDWDGNGSVDGTTGTYASGVNAPIGHTYTSVGTYTVKARTVQSNDTTKVSAWSTAFTITITNTSYNCESNSFDPSLTITTNNSLLGVALNAGTRWYHNIFNTGSPACFRNTSSNNYFVPTKTQGERDAFMGHLPPGVSKANGGW